jgi:hypothetical protein
MRITINIPDDKIADVLEGAASRYWCGGLEFGNYPRTRPSCWHALMAGDIAFVTVLDVEGSADAERPNRHRVTRTKVAIAFDIMAREHPNTFGEALGGDGLDANTGDVLLQLAALGENLYA